jgi:uncharacterized protein
MFTSPYELFSCNGTRDAGYRSFAIGNFGDYYYTNIKMGLICKPFFCIRIMPHMDLARKKKRLEKILGGYDSLLVAFSGGVDSTFLLAVARNVLKEKVIAVTSASPFQPRREIQAAVEMAKQLGVPHSLLKTEAITAPELIANTRNRCYICKKHLGEKLRDVANKMGIDTIAHGANLDDTNDFRPGFQAAQETGMVAPLLDAGLTKADIRALSKEMGLETWNKPAMACLATRIPYDTPITMDVLDKIDRAETAVLAEGFSNCRVRCHGNCARIELLPTELERMLEKSCRDNIVRILREIGFLHIAIDLEGYGQGRMNRTG